MRALVRRGWRRSAASALLTVGMLALIGYLAAALTVRGVEAATGFAREVPALMQSVGHNLRIWEARAFEYASSRAGRGVRLPANGAGLFRPGLLLPAGKAVEAASRS